MLIVGEDDEMFMTRSVDVTPKTTEQRIIVQPTRLLQRHTTRSTREADETHAVGAERCRADDNQCTAA